MVGGWVAGGWWLVAAELLEQNCKLAGKGVRVYIIYISKDKYTNTRILVLVDTILLGSNMITLVCLCSS